MGDQGLTAGYSSLERAVETVAVLLVPVLVVTNFLHLEAPAWFLPLAALAGWALADLASGLVHWAGDSFGSPATPLIGNSFIRPFREHHDDPRAMTRHDFVETNGESAVGAAVLLAVALFSTSFLQALLLFTAIGAVLANQCHKWAHQAEVPALVRLLQRSGIILAPETHRIHHRRPHDKHYCTASGWMNAPFNALLKALR